MRRVLGVALVVAAIAAIALWLLRPAPAPEPEKAPNLSRFERAFERNHLRLSTLPAYRERLEGLPRAEARNAIQALAAKGMHRLGEDRLRLRTLLVGRMLEGLDVSTCSAMVTGKQNETVHDAALLVLDPDSLEQWVDLSFEAAAAELEARPVAAPNATQIQLALQALFDAASEADRERLRQALANLGDQPPLEACWAARTTYAAVPGLDAQASAILARELARP